MNSAISEARISWDLISTPHKMKVLLLLFFLTSPILCRKDYDGDYLWLLAYYDGYDVSSLKKILDEHKVDVWSLLDEKFPDQLSFLLPHNVRNDVIKAINQQQFPIMMWNDIQVLINHEYRDNPPDDASAGDSDNFPLDVYHTFESISSNLDHVAKKYPEYAEVTTIGKTYAGNPLKVLQVHSKENDRTKGSIWIISGMHAREWITPAVSLYNIHKMVKNTREQSDLNYMLDDYNYYFLPVANPDGYNYTWFNDRLWQKNLAPNKDSSCIGTDLNRNFDVAFENSTGSTVDPCSENYRGSEAFSEHETRAIRDAIWKDRGNVKAVISLQSYGEQLMSPYGYSKKLPPDYKTHMRFLNLINHDDFLELKTQFKVGRIATIQSNVYGCLTDWAYEKGVAKYSFVINTRDRGMYGYLLPNSVINETAEDIYIILRNIGSQRLS